MSKSLLQLEDCWIARLDFRSGNLQHVSTSERDSEVIPRVTWDIKKSEEDHSYLVTLRVSDHSQDDILLDLQGTFTFGEEVPTATQSRMISVNAPTILYGIARGVIGTITGLAPNKRYLLPSINVLSLVEKRERQERSKARQAKSGATG